MKIQTLLGITLLSLAGSSFAAAQWPTEVMDANDAGVLAFYQERCSQWAGDSGLQADQQEQFLANCLGSASGLWPVGTDDSE
jgi:hypothetical protein